MTASSSSVASFLLRGGSIALLSRIVAVGAGLVVQMLLARLIPPQELGAYFLVQSIVVVLADLANLGITQPLSRILAQLVGAGNARGARGTLATGLRISVLPVAAVALLYGSAAGRWVAQSVFDSPVMAGGAVAAAAWTAGAALQNLGAAAARGFHRVGFASWLRGPLASLLLALALGAVMLARGESDFDTVLLLSAAGTWVSVAVCAFVLGWSVRGVSSERSTTAHEMLRSGFPVLGTALLSTVVIQADLWIVGAQLGAEEVALYGAAKRLIRLIGLPLVIVAQVVPPLVADLYAKGELERLQRGVRGAATLAGLPALLALVVVMAGAEPLLEVIFGEYYASASLFLRILCLERIVFVLVGPANVVLMMTGHEAAVFRIYAWTGALWLAAMYLGGTLAGAWGVAIGYAVSSAIRQIWTLAEAHRRTGIHTHFNPFHMGSMVEALRRALRR